jgi:hypothetical protein
VKKSVEGWRGENRERNRNRNRKAGVSPSDPALHVWLGTKPEFTRSLQGDEGTLVVPVPFEAVGSAFGREDHFDDKAVHDDSVQGVETVVSSRFVVRRAAWEFSHIYGLERVYLLYSVVTSIGSIGGVTSISSIGGVTSISSIGGVTSISSIGSVRSVDGDTTPERGDGNQPVGGRHRVRSR